MGGKDSRIKSFSLIPDSNNQQRADQEDPGGWGLVVCVPRCGMTCVQGDTHLAQRLQAGTTSSLLLVSWI